MAADPSIKVNQAMALNNAVTGQTALKSMATTSIANAGAFTTWQGQDAVVNDVAGQALLKGCADLLKAHGDALNAQAAGMQTYIDDLKNALAISGA